MRRSFDLAAMAIMIVALSGCSYLAYEAHNTDSALTYGFNPDELTPKVDENPDYAKKRHKISTYMWRASLRAVNVFPLATSDAKTGVIVTDWYSAPENPDDRRQITIKVLGDDIRRDMLRVSVVRQLRKDGLWQDVPPHAAMAQNFEDIILRDATYIRGW